MHRAVAPNLTFFPVVNIRYFVAVFLSHLTLRGVGLTLPAHLLGDFLRGLHENVSFIACQNK
jgi:hypothetical protein